MKKIFLSAVTIVGFAFYIIFFGKSDTLTYVDNTPTPVVETIPPNPEPTPSPSPKPSPSPSPSPAPTPTPTPVPKGMYVDGSYTGFSADAYYGYIQVKAVIKGGKLYDVVFLDHPQDRGTSIRINNYAMPILRSEAIKAQNANVNLVSGATDSSLAFRQSLADALTQAKS